MESSALVDEGAVVATLIRRRGDTPSRRAVLYVHALNPYGFYRDTLGLPVEALEGHDGPWAMGEVEGLTLVSDGEFEVGPAQSRWVPVRLHIPYGSAKAGSHPIHFDVGTVDGEAHVRERSVFLVPR